MFKIGTALVTGVIAAFLALLSALSAGARFSTTAGRSLLVFLVVAALVFLVAFLLEKQGKREKRPKRRMIRVRRKSCPRTKQMGKRQKRKQRAKDRMRKWKLLESLPQRFPEEID